VVERVRAEVERGDLQFIRLGQTQPQQRINQSERLNRLLGVKIVACRLVCEVKTRPDDCHLAQTAGLDPFLPEAARLHRLQRFFNREVRSERRVEREAAFAVELRAFDELFARIALQPRGGESPGIALLLSERAQ
jgi:hypothetical protein